MSQYYQSNSPYNRAHEQKDGLANGAIMGGMMGAGAMGGVQAYGERGLTSMYQRAGDKFSAASAVKPTVSGNGDMGSAVKEALANKQAGLNKISKGADRIEKAGNAVHNNLGKGGNWKSRTAAYGISALAGMGAGAGLDAMNR